MNNLLIYFVKSGIAMALFYGVYRLFMDNETNHSLNRYYLVSTLVLSLVLPILPIGRLFTVNQQFGIPVVFISGGEPAPVVSGGGSVNPSGIHLSGPVLAMILYLGGIGVLIVTLMVQLFRLVFLKRKGSRRYGHLKIIFVQRDIAPFSILNRVFVSQQAQGDPKLNTILDHEYAHYRFLHFFDGLLLEFVTIFQWFNPLSWLYLKSLKEIHEYQADAAVIQKGEVRGSYQALLVNQLTGAEVFRLANGFNKSLTKKRMIMMTKTRSKKGAWLKAFLAMPVLAGLLIGYAANSSVAGSESGDYVVKGTVTEAETGEPIPGVNVVCQGTTNATHTDMQGNFVLHVDAGDAVVVYSFVGYETAVTRGAGEYQVRMKRKVFEISGEEDTPPGDVEKPKKDSREKQDIGPPGEQSEEVIYIVEDLPKFQGRSHNAAKNYIQEHLEYPDEARQKGLQGQVFVEFLVDHKGKVKDAKVVRGVDPLLDMAALKAVSSMPDWTPGMQRGKPVSVLFILPVEFNLAKE